ncbi:hypothetical protein BCR44DRAFT_1039887 [Catenaria anguillulae PL171]|uniref:Uncharacterized protein n=1 Tax=Catenaria anguillulae PL171 TaxID=765915 RepID=A0A1Y2H5K3_9FUNG|nr:hypothetical protein BCR44DRAFT_1039887 [Catenaria anguillulae PL171]
MDGDRMLNLYIFDYCRKRNYTATALCFYNEVLASDPASSSAAHPPADTASNPGGTPAAGTHPRVSEFSQIPPVSIPIDSPDGGFLYEWWTVFWDMFKARTMSGGSREALVFFEAQLEKEQRLLQLQMQSQAAMSGANGGSMPGQPGSLAGTPPNAHVPMPGMPANAAAAMQQQHQHAMAAQAHAQQMAMTRAQSVMSNAGGNPPTPAQMPMHLINGQVQQQATGGAGGGNPGQVIMRPDGTLAIQQQAGAPAAVQGSGMYAPGATPGPMTPQTMAHPLPIQAQLQQQQQPAPDTASGNSQSAGGAINSSAVISPQLQTALFTQAMTELGFNGRDTKTLTDDEKSRVLANMQARLSKLTASGTPLSVLNQQVIGAQQQQGGVRPQMQGGPGQMQQPQMQMQMQQQQQQQQMQMQMQMQGGVRPPQMQGQQQPMMAPPGMIPGGPGQQQQQPGQPIPGQSPQLAQQRLAIQQQQQGPNSAAAVSAGRMRQGNSVGPMSAPTPPPGDQQPGQAPTRKRQRNDGTFTMSPSPTMAHAQLFAHQQQVVQGANAALQQQIAAQQQQQQQAMAMQQQQGGTPVPNQLTGTPQLMSPPPQGNPAGPPPPGGVAANGTGGGGAGAAGVTQATLQQFGALPFAVPPGMNQAQVQALQQRHTRYEQLIVQAKINNVQLSHFEQNMLREHHKFLEQTHIQLRGGVPLAPGQVQQQGGLMSPQLQQQQQQQQQQQMGMMQQQGQGQAAGQQPTMQMQQQQQAMMQQQGGTGVRPPQMQPGMVQPGQHSNRA